MKITVHKTMILTFVSYDCEIWSLTFEEESKLQVFENKVLGKILGAKDDIKEQFRILQNKELHDLYISPVIIGIMKST
jgi:hypothetical protein